MFGEQLPERAMARAEALCRETGLLVVLGSSLEVWPVAGLPGETVRAGGTLAIVNLGETPYDGDAALLVRESVAVVLEQVARSSPRDPARSRKSCYDCAMATTKPMDDDVIARLAGKGEQAVHASPSSRAAPERSVRSTI